MDSKNGSFEVEFTDECIEEMTEIYEYISNNLKEDNAAKRQQMPKHFEFRNKFKVFFSTNYFVFLHEK